MSTTHSDLVNLMQQAPYASSVSKCHRLWEKALDLALKVGDNQDKAVCLINFCSTSGFLGEDKKYLTAFWRLHELLNTCEVSLDEDATYYLSYIYWHLPNLALQNPVFSAKQIDDSLKIAREYRQKHGISLYDVNNFQVKADYVLGRDYNLDQIVFSAHKNNESTCPLCDATDEVQWLSLAEKWDEACIVGQKALTDTNINDSCMQQPALLLSTLLRPYLQTGQYKKAYSAHIRAYQSIQKDPDLLPALAENLEFLVYASCVYNPLLMLKAEKILWRHFSWWPQCKDPSELLRIARAACLVLEGSKAQVEALNGRKDHQKLPLLANSRDFKFVSVPDLRYPSRKDAYRWCRDLAFAIADAYDSRPGQVKAVHRQRTTAYLTRPAPDGLPLCFKRKIWFTDEFSLDSQDAKNTSEESLYEQVSQVHFPDPASSDIKPVFTKETSENSFKLPPLNLHGPWRQMPLADLLWQCIEEKNYSFSIYGLAALEKMLVAKAQIELPDFNVFLSPLPFKAPEDRLKVYLAKALFWDIKQEALSLLEMQADPDLLATENGDCPAYKTIIAAQNLLSKKRYVQACRLADKAMRLPSKEPLGVRLAGLNILTIGAEKTGHLNEAIKASRYRNNLLTALGLNIIKFNSTLELAQLLMKNSKQLEAAELLREALVEYEDFAESSPFKYSLRSLLLNAYYQLEMNAEAGGQAFMLAKTFKAQGEYELAAVRFRDAASAFVLERDFLRCYEAFELAVTSLDQAISICPPAKLGDLQVQLYITLLNFSAAIVSEPGPTSGEQVNKMEELMSRARNLIDHPQLSEAMETTPAYMHANWYREFARFHWLTRTDPHNALTYMNAAYEAFLQVDAPKEAGISLLEIASMYIELGEIEIAKEKAQKALEIFRENRWANSQEIRKATNFLNMLKKQNPNI